MVAGGESDSGSERVFPDRWFVGSGFLNSVRATPATTATFEIIEHSAFGRSLFGIGAEATMNYVASALLYNSIGADLPDRLSMRLEKYRGQNEIVVCPVWKSAAAIGYRMSSM